jgi:hypothetical protein
MEKARKKLRESSLVGLKSLLGSAPNLIYVDSLYLGLGLGLVLGQGLGSGLGL